MLVLTGGTPRSGTTWLTHLAQGVLGHTDETYRTVNANSPQEVREAILSHCLGENTVVHFHAVIPLVQEVAKNGQAIVWYAFRDPGDILVSQMRWRDIDFEKALRMATASMNQFQKAVNDSNIRIVPYALLQKAPEAFIFQLGREMGKILNFGDIHSIIEACDISRNQKIIQEISEGQEHQDSLLAPGHIQSGKLGRWKEELSPQQQERVQNTFQNFYSLFPDY